MTLCPRRARLNYILRSGGFRLPLLSGRRFRRPRRTSNLHGFSRKLNIAQENSFVNREANLRGISIPRHI